jgi:hypothetical protein
MYRVGKTRATDPAFSNGVKSNYDWKCAACGIDWPLLQAAHLVPFAVNQDNNTANGICLCPNHHAAFDADIIAFDMSGLIYVNTDEINSMVSAGQGANIHLVIDPLKDQLLPSKIDQSAYLKQRFDMEAEEGTWRPVRECRGTF